MLKYPKVLLCDPHNRNISYPTTCTVLFRKYSIKILYISYFLLFDDTKKHADSCS